MKPSKLIRHLETNHSNHATKSYRILSTPWSEFETSETYLAGCFYQKSHLKLPSKKTHTIGKNACETYLLETEKLLLGKTSKANMRRKSLFGDIDQRCTSDLPENVKDQVITKMKTSPTPMLFVDESTDVTSCAQLLVFMTRIQLGDIKFLFCEELQTTSADVRER